MQTGFYEYSSRKPQPRTFPHTSASKYDDDCLCPSCRAEYQRRHPEEYAVFQSQPTPNAKVTDLTSLEMRKMDPRGRMPKKTLLRRKTSAGKFEHVAVALIISV